MKDLILHVKGKYFDQIKSGEKRIEYRLFNDYWRKKFRDENDEPPYERIIIARGYPMWSESEKWLTFPNTTIEIITIQHEEFGPDPVKVFAIHLEHWK